MRIKLTVIILFLLSSFFLSTNLDKPFVGIHDHNGARFGNIAKNYIKYWGQARFGPIEQKNPDGAFEYYTHYPSLLPLTIAVFYKIFGQSEFVTRLVPMIASSLMVCFLFLAFRNFWEYKIALFSALFLIATPMFRYFGKNPVHEIFVSLFGIVTFYGISKLIKTGQNKNTYAIIFIGSILSALSGWGGYFVFPAVIYSFWKKKTPKSIVVLYIFIHATLYLGHFFYTYYLTGSVWGGGLYEALLYRSSQSPQEFGFLEFIMRLRLWSTTLFTLTLLLSLVATIFVIGNKKINNKSILPFIFLFGGIYPLIFSNATYQHNYFIYNLLPFVAVSSCLGIYALTEKYKKSLFYPLCMIVLILTFFERQSFLKALEESGQDNIARSAGIEINTRVDKTETVLVQPQDYFYSRHPFLNYYSERIITPNQTADWILTINGGEYNLRKNE
jgi:hypothetical protein